MLQLKRGVGAPVLALILLSRFPVFASELCATVMDYAQLPLPSASINATNLTTGKSYAARTDTKGMGCLSDVPEGLYSVEASLVGFLHVKYYPVRAVPFVKQALSFWLPFAEINEGGLGEESTLSGTLLKGGLPVQAAEVCLVAAAGTPRTCMRTNDLGEYALLGPAGIYLAEVHTRDGKVFKSKVDMSAPGIYRNRLSLDGSIDRP